MTHNHLTKLQERVNENSQRAEAASARMYSDLPPTNDANALMHHGYRLLAEAKELQSSATMAIQIAGECFGLAEGIRSGDR